MRKVYVGGAFVSTAAIVASWVTFGLGGTTGGRACPLPAFPDATCTGIPAGTVLTPASVDVNGDLQVTVADTVVDSVDVPRCIIIAASGVLVKNSRAKCVFMEVGPASNPANPRLTIQDSELDCGNRTDHAPADPRTAVNNANYNAYRNRITNCENGFDFSTDVTIEDNYVYDLWNSNDPDGPHTDAVQSTDGSRSIIRHNTFYAQDDGCVYPAGADGSCNGTSAVNINNSGLGPHTDDLLVRFNLLAGGTYTLYCPVPSVTNVTITNNEFSTSYKPTIGQYGPSADCASSGGEASSGNVYHESGLPLVLG